MFSQVNKKLGNGTIRMAHQKLDLIAQQSLTICEQLERGQADTPLADGIAKLLEQIHHAPITVVLLGLTSDSIEQSLAWLYGDVFKNFSLDTAKWPGFVEITLSEKGYAFGLQKEKASQFEQQEAFSQALQIEMGTTKSSVNNPFAMRLPETGKAKGLRLLIPDSADALLDSPSLLNAIIAQTNFAMVAAPLRYALTREDHEAVEALTGNMRGFWPLLTVDELAEEASFPDVGWWEQHNGAVNTLVPKLITKHVDASLPEWLTDTSSSEREQYINSFFARKLSDNLAAIYERYQQQAALLEQRKAKLTSPNSSLTVGVDRREVDKLKQFCDDQILTARKDLDAQIQTMALQTSSIAKVIEQSLVQIAFSDIHVEPSHSILKLSLQQSFTENFEQNIKQESKRAFKQYYEQAQSHIHTTWEQLNNQLQALAVNKLAVLDIPLLQTYTDTIGQRLEFNLNYRGEMPKRTFMTRLSESRKLIMGLSMATMVLGGVAKAGWGVDLRSSVMLLAPIILIGGFIYTYIQWPKEDAEKLEKELDKVRDNLKSEVRRVVSDIQRFIQQQLFELLDTQKRKIQKSLAITIQEHSDASKQQVEAERSKQQQNAQKIDQELRQWQNTQRQLERLKADAQALSRKLT